MLNNFDLKWLILGVLEVPESSKRLTLASSLERPIVDDFKVESKPIEKSFQFEIVKKPSKTKSDALKIRKILQNLKLDLDKIKSQSQNELETIDNFKDFNDESLQKSVKIEKRSNIPASSDQQRNDLVWATVGNGRVTVLPLSIGKKNKLIPKWLQFSFYLSQGFCSESEDVEDTVNFAENWK